MSSFYTFGTAWMISELSPAAIPHWEKSNPGISTAVPLPPKWWFQVHTWFINWYVHRLRNLTHQCQKL